MNGSFGLGGESKNDIEVRNRRTISRAMRLLSQIIVGLGVVAMLILVVRVAMLNMVPAKYFYLGALAVMVLSGVILWLNLRKDTAVWLRMIMTVIAIILVGGSGFGILKINETYGFLERNLGVKNVTVESTVEVNDDVRVARESFTIYLMGIDTREDGLPANSRNDVNIVLTVNPAEKHLLMSWIPRDYYVYLHGLGGGLRDKLTHAGVVGGTALAKATVEDLLGIEIDHYVKVNFNFVKRLVDAVGGIVIQSDTAFTAYTDPGCRFVVGENVVNGDCALAFARERMTYQSGDVHRGENQEYVIGKVLEKISSSDVLVARYSEILAALDGTFETSIDMQDVTDLVRLQLEQPGGWIVETANVMAVGGAMELTYSYPNQRLYVALPNQTSIDEVRQKIYNTK